MVCFFTCMVDRWGITSLARSRFPKPDEPRYEDRLASVGTRFAIVELRVADAEDNALPDGETGQILLRGDTVMPGYWRDEAASATAHMSTVTRRRTASATNDRIRTRPLSRNAP